MDYYVYVYLDIRKPGKYVYGDLEFNYLPFYVGKGKGNRMLEHLHEKTIINYHKTRIISKIQAEGLCPVIFKVKENLSDKEALRIEIETIAKIGRFNMKKGPLTNLTDGGDGTSGWIQSEATKEKRKNTLFSKDSKWRDSINSDSFSEIMSKASHFNDETFKKNLSERYKGTGNPMYGKNGSDKQKEAVKKAHAEGKIKLTEEGKRRIREANNKRKGSKLEVKRKDAITYILTSPSGNVHTLSGAKELQEFCKLNKLQYHTLKKNFNQIITEAEVSGKRIIAKNTIGWKIEKN